MRLAALLLPCLLQAPGLAVADEPACEQQRLTAESRAVSCMIPKAAQARNFEFRADFAGSHDDTKVSIEPLLDGRPLACEADSRKELFFSFGDKGDGEVNLVCRFAVPANADGDTRLQVSVHWYHAQYLDFSLKPR